MLLEHMGRRPRVAASTYVAPNAIVWGDVVIGEDCRILFGAVLTSDGGPVALGDRVIVMEQALVRGRESHHVTIAPHSLIGPHAHVNGAELAEAVFIATGAAIFPGARVGAGAEVRINGVVHANSVLPDGGMVPIGWVAVGNPARVLPPSDHKGIWEIQRTLDFVETVYGVERGTPPDEMDRITAAYAELFGRHRDDRVVG